MSETQLDVSARLGNGVRESVNLTAFDLVDLDPQQIDSIAACVPGGAENIQDIYPLSPIQEGMLFHHLLNQRGDTYLLSTVFELPSAQHVSAFVSALRSAINRHDALRVAVVVEGLPHAVQVVHREVDLPVEQVVVDPGMDALTVLRQRIKSQHQRFDLSRAPLMKLLLAVPPHGGKCYAILQAHHLVFDYRTRKALIAEAMAHLDHREDELPIPAPYRDHLEQLLSPTRIAAAQIFFRDKLHEVTQATAPFGLLDVHADGSQLEEGQDELDPSLIEQVRAQSHKHGVSVARLLHASWALVLAATAGRSDVVFGTVLSTRQSKGETQATLGISINTLPLRLNLAELSARELVLQTDRELGDLMRHAAASLTQAQRCSGVAVGAPLFTTLLNYRRTLQSQSVESSASGVRMFEHHGTWTSYPITMQIDDLGDRIVLVAQADRRVGPQRMMDYFSAAIRSLMTALEHGPHAPALSLNVLQDGERHRLIEEFNDSRVRYAPRKPVHQLIEDQVRRTPNEIAVVCGDRELTYAALNERANRLATTLMRLGVRADSRVAVCLERSVDLITALLAVLKAGGAYVPMDVSYPVERLRHMINDSAPVVLLTNERFAHLATGAVRTLAIDSQDAYADEQCVEGSSSDVEAQLRCMAYVIYTSGSTGTPKGVAVEHAQLLNLIHWHCAAFDVKRGVRCSSVAAIGFDAATWEIWPPLSVGATLVLASAEVASNAETLVHWWSSQALDVSFLPTPMAEFVLSRDLMNPCVRTLLVGGDRLRLRPVLDKVELINNYGPTETTVVATSGRIRDDDDVLHIGRPMANARVYLLDERLQPVPLGVYGELYISGEGVARGYLGRPELTAGRFLADPFASEPGQRMYRSGDLARWRADGTIEYLGRNDHQIKIRGYRIELGEIDAQLLRHAKVHDAVVDAKRSADSDPSLVAYYVPREGAKIAVEELRSYLKALLPDYMIPSAFVPMESLPLTAHGKLDRSALPAPIRMDSRSCEAPKGEREERLAAIWQELLKVPKVSRGDHFFELGGHSLLAVNALFRINRALQCALNVTDLYRNPVLSDLAARIGEFSDSDEWVELTREAILDERIVARSELPVTPAQNILLTGATGFVGRFVLAQLLRETDATIYCLVRARSADESGLSRLQDTLKQWGLWRDAFEGRIVAISGDLRLPALGMSEADSRLLAERVDCIYHGGASMNHLESYAMAKAANVSAAVELIKLATSGRPKLINHLSSLSVFRSNGGAARIVDETTSIDHEQHTSAKGYIASKWVSEKIVLLAHERGIPCNVFRVGLVWADTEQGRYDELQQGDRLLRSCLISGFGIESYRPRMAPTPVDFVANAIVTLATRHAKGGGVFHIASPEPTWSGMFERCNAIAGTQLKLLPYYDWICQIKRLYHRGWPLPIVPLIEFAFALNEEQFADRVREDPTAGMRFDCGRTYVELVRAGIRMPAVDDDQLRVFVQGLRGVEINVPVRSAVQAGH